MYRRWSGVPYAEYERYRIYDLQWFGSNVPRGLVIEGKRIDWVQHGKAYHSPTYNGMYWEADDIFEEIGIYERIDDPSNSYDANGHKHQHMLVFVKADVE